MGRIGLLGGTFDPPHIGHLWLAETAAEQLNLDQILFLPVGQPPHKQGRMITAVSHRLVMLQLAINHIPTFTIDTSDIDRPTPHTTVTLLPLLRQKYPHATFSLLMGTDSLRDLPTWSHPQQLIQQCRLAALPRPEVHLDWSQLETAVPHIQTAVDLLAGPTVALSSTAIRAWAQNGRSLRFLLPPSVSDYILTHKLYTH